MAASLRSWREAYS